MLTLVEGINISVRSNVLNLFSFNIISKQFSLQIFVEQELSPLATYPYSCFSCFYFLKQHLLGTFRGASAVSIAISIFNYRT